MEIDSIDIFCQVIDNYGDVGVAYRLAREFKRVYPNKKLRFVINQIEELNLIRKSENQNFSHKKKLNLLNHTFH